MFKLPQASPAVLKSVAVYIAVVAALGIVEVALLHGKSYWLWVALFVLTLPWSVVPWLMTWALMHDGVTAWGLVRMAVIFALLNSAIVVLLALRRAARRAEV